MFKIGSLGSKPDFLKKHTWKRISWASWILCGFIIYQIVICAAWVIPSRHYIGFDEGWHLEVSQYLYHGLTDYGILGLFYKFIHATQAKPPLVSLLPVPMYLVFGNHAIVATGVNLVWMVLLNIFLFRLVQHFWEDGPALIACVSLQTMPLFPGLSRLVMAEYGTAALVVIFIYYLFVKPISVSRSIFLGIIGGLGLLQKVLFPTYIIGPLIWAMIVEIRKQDRNSWYRVLNLWLLTFGVAFILAGPWYLINLEQVWGYTIQSTYGEFAKVYRFSTRLDDLRALWFYLYDFLNAGITAYQATVFVICVCAYLIWPREKKERPFSSEAVGIILWFIVPFLVYLPSLYRNFKFMMSFFAPFSIVLGIVMWNLVKVSRWRWPILAVLFIWPNFAILYASFPFGHLNQPYNSLKIGPLEFLPQRGYLGFPKSGRWPYREILEYVTFDGSCTKGATGKFPSVGMAVDTSEFNRNAMIYEATKRRLPVKVYWAPLGGMADPKYDLKTVISIASQQDYIVFRSINPTDPEFTNKFNDEIRQRIEKGELLFQLVKQFPLPDGTTALVYRRMIRPSLSLNE